MTRYSISNFTNLDGVQETLDDLADAVGMTLGPHGRSVVLENPLQEHDVTKDGHTVMGSLIERDPLRRTVLDLAKSVTRRLVMEVGDGTTSAMVAAAELHRRVRRLAGQNPGVPPRRIMAAVEWAVNLLAEEIRKEALPAGGEQLRDVALMALNGDVEMADMVGEAYAAVGRTGIVRIDKDRNPNPQWSLKRGIALKRGMLEPKVFANERDDVRGLRCHMENAFVLMGDTEWSHEDGDRAHTILQALLAQTGGCVRLVILGPGFSPPFLRFLVQNQKALADAGGGFCPVEYAVSTEGQQARFDDLAIMLGANPVRRSMTGSKMDWDPDLSVLGRVGVFSADDKDCRFMEGGGTDEDMTARRREIDALVGLLEAEVEKGEQRKSDLADAKARRAAMGDSVAVISAGGTSEQERTLRHHALEDAVFACRAALMSGVVVGCGLSAPQAMNRLHDRLNDPDDRDSVDFNWKGDMVELGLVGPALRAVSGSMLEITKRVLEPTVVDPNELNETLVHLTKNSGLVRNAASGCNEHLLGKRTPGTHAKVTKIINPAMTDIRIMETAVNVVGLLALSGGFAAAAPLRSNEA